MNRGWSCEEDLFPVTDCYSVLLTVSWHPWLQPWLLIWTHFQRQKHTNVFSQETRQGNSTKPDNSCCTKSKRRQKSQLAGGGKCNEQSTTKHLFLTVKYSLYCITVKAFLSEHLAPSAVGICGLKSFPRLTKIKLDHSINRCLLMQSFFSFFFWNTKLNYRG